ncbi:MAG: phosphate/phosphite/phosphonate ABC transporter substrate-binding protein [Anaerolineae bacterium]|nr:phosphate/phosphite/phosphonate ABC transporter substrate-binding protein [Anaerolineae bacterium]
MKKLISGFIVLVMTAALSVGLVSAQNDNGKSVDRTDWPKTFTIYADEPVRTYLERTLAVKVQDFKADTYNEVIEGMRADKVDAFEVGPLSYLLAAKVAGAEAIAVANYSTTVDLKRNPGYYSLMFTVKGSGIASIDDLEGKRIAFSELASTSGYLIPVNDVMTAKGFDKKNQLDTFFDKVVLTGSHPDTILSVSHEKTDAGATSDSQLVSQVDEAGLKVCGVPAGTPVNEAVFVSAMTDKEIMAIYNDCPDGDIAVFHQSSLIPSTPFAIKGSLPQSFKDAVQAALLDIANNQDTVNTIGAYYVDPRKIDSSLTSIDAFYDPLRATAKLLEVDLTAN